MRFWARFSVSVMTLPALKPVERVLRTAIRAAFGSAPGRIAVESGACGIEAWAILNRPASPVQRYREAPQVENPVDSSWVIHRIRSNLLKRR